MLLEQESRAHWRHRIAFSVPASVGYLCCLTGFPIIVFCVVRISGRVVQHLYGGPVLEVTWS